MRAAPHAIAREEVAGSGVHEDLPVVGAGGELRAAREVGDPDAGRAVGAGELVALGADLDLLFVMLVTARPFVRQVVGARLVHFPSPKQNAAS